MREKAEQALFTDKYTAFLFPKSRVTNKTQFVLRVEYLTRGWQKPTLYRVQSNVNNILKGKTKYGSRRQFTNGISLGRSQKNRLF